MFHCRSAILLIWSVLLLTAGRSPAGAQAASPPTVSSVRLAGIRNLEMDPLLESLSLKPGVPFTPARLAADRKMLLDTGFFRSVSASQRTADGRTEVTFTVTEWPRVAHIRVLGNSVVPLVAIQETISTRLGEVLCTRRLQDDVRAIEQLYREHGYVARISDRILEEATRSGILRFEILELTIEEVQVEGGTPELQARARRVLLEGPGILYRPEAVTQDQRRLLAVRGVESAAPKVEASAPGKVRIRWILNGAPTDERASGE